MGKRLKYHHYPAYLPYNLDDLAVAPRVVVCSPLERYAHRRHFLASSYEDINRRVFVVYSYPYGLPPRAS
jgi:hypothetical protein